MNLSAPGKIQAAAIAGLFTAAALHILTVNGVKIPDDAGPALTGFNTILVMYIGHLITPQEACPAQPSATPANSNTKPLGVSKMTDATTNPVADLKKNALAIAAAPVLSALQSLQATPTALNLAAQGVALQGALIGAAPELEALGIKDIAALLEQRLTAVLAAASATTATVPSATA